MDAHQFLRSSRVLIVAGKGGVGKSTVSAALACLAADTGLRTLHVSLDKSARRLPARDLLGAMTITPGRALADYLGSRGLGLVSRQLANSGLVELVASTAPGIDDLLVLGKIKSLTKTPEPDLVVVDGPAAGHALDLLRTPAELRRAVQGGPVGQQADDVLAMLADPSLCRVVLVTTPAMTPVTETVESAASLVRDTRVTIGCVVVNMCDSIPPAIDASRLSPDLADAFHYARARADAQQAAIDALGSAISVPHIECARHGLDGDELVTAVAGELRSSFAHMGSAT